MSKLLGHILLAAIMLNGLRARAKDLKKQRCDYWRGYPSPWAVWKGVAPTIEVSGPGVARQPVPDAWLKH